MRLPAILQARLERVEMEGNLRHLSVRRGIDFSSNDYLGFAEDPVLRARVTAEAGDLPLGATGSRLLRGNLAYFEEVEERLARFSGTEAALIFPSGYQANLALHAALPGPGDIVFSDERNHASIIDGLKLSKTQREIFPHRNVDSLEGALTETRGSGLRIIVTESVFSMSGERAPLARLAALAHERGALLVVDEAHATGVFGAGLSAGLAAGDRVFARVHTGGKALGGAGAWVAGSRELKRYLVNFARPFIYSTAPSPWLACSLDEGVRYYLSGVGAERARHLENLCAIFREEAGVDGPGPIFFIRMGESRAAVEAAGALGDEGYDVRPIRPPTVPIGEAGLRVTLRSPLSRETVAKFARGLRKARRT